MSGYSGEFVRALMAEKMELRAQLAAVRSACDEADRLGWHRNAGRKIRTILDRAALASPRPAEAEPTAERPDPSIKLWCEFCDCLHVHNIPETTYLCDSCGFGQWGIHEAKRHEFRQPGHVTFEVPHRLRPAADPTPEPAEPSYGPAAFCASEFCSNPEPHQIHDSSAVPASSPGGDAWHEYEPGLFEPRLCAHDNDGQRCSKYEDAPIHQNWRTP